MRKREGGGRMTEEKRRENYHHYRCRRLFFLPSSQGPAVGKVFTSYIGGGGFLFHASKRENEWVGWQGRNFHLLSLRTHGKKKYIMFQPAAIGESG